jgi:hypothetical protein
MIWEMFVWNSFPEFQGDYLMDFRRHSKIIHGVIFGCIEKHIDERKWQE